MNFSGVFFAPLPRLFWSEYLEGPFATCIDCEQPLVESRAYVVQKRYVAGEAVFEMAMCERCREKLTEEYSEETREAISQYMAEQFRRNSQGEAEEPEAGDDEVTGLQLLDHCMNHCTICGTEREKCHRYSLAGLCHEQDIIAQRNPFGQTPLMVCEKCELGMADLVSQKTRESWDRFIQEHFDGPPGVELDSPSSYPVAF